jgi:hypothetical protein
MSATEDQESFIDEVWEKKYFSLILDLSERNASRYESQAKSLLENKIIEVSINGIEISYKVTPLGCRFYTSQNADGIRMGSWHRMGWSKSSKLKALPNFFAKSEADVLID